MLLQWWAACSCRKELRLLERQTILERQTEVGVEQRRKRKLVPEPKFLWTTGNTGIPVKTARKKVEIIFSLYLFQKVKTKS